MRQEALTHLWKRLGDYDKTKSKMTTFITVITRNHFRNMILSPMNRRDKPKGIEEDMWQGGFWDKQYTKKEKGVIADGFDVLDYMEYPESYVVSELLSGRTQQSVSDELGTSRQRISWIWNNYINTVQDTV